MATFLGFTTGLFLGISILMTIIIIAGWYLLSGFLEVLKEFKNETKKPRYMKFKETETE